MSDIPNLLRDPGFTPGRRHVVPLLDLLASPDDSLPPLIERALLRVPDLASPLVLARLPASTPPARGRLARLLGRLASSSPPLLPPLLALLDDPDLPTRRQAALALGKLPGPGVEDALLQRWVNDASPAWLRALTEALGKVGGERSLAFLRAQRSNDPELTRLLGRACVMLERSASTSVALLDVRRPCPGVSPVVLRCKRGLENILLDEAQGVVQGAEVAGPGLVKGRFEGPLVRLCNLRTALSFGFSLPAVRTGPQGDAAALISALQGPQGKALLRAFGEGPARFRVAWRDGGHRRAVVWEAARRAAEAEGLINDPSSYQWELLAWERDGSLFTELIPHALPDLRFAYRAGDVPAASHPTVAAALARLGGARPDDVVWDPFVGSGLELCERALLGPYAELHGTDIDPAALAIARQNLDNAGASSVSLAHADARGHRVQGLSLVLSNPPLGHRVARHQELTSVLCSVVDGAARQLIAGGRLVWLSPHGDRTALAGERAGLEVERVGRVDLGGVEAELQVMRKK